jgi:hypothetical protein
MNNDAYTLAITDDEAAAIALQANGAWRTPLPTVEQASEAGLASAVLRGRRSLIVRDLARPDGTALGAAAEVLAGLGTGPRAAFMLVDERGAWIPAGLTVYLYGPAPDKAEMSHVVAPAGVHYFRLAPPAGQWHALTELAEAVFESGFTEAGAGGRQPAAALVSVVGDAGVRTIRVTRGEAGAGSAAFSTAAQAVAWLTA